MAYSRTLGTDFWFEFDNFFLWQVQQEVLNAIGIVGGLGTLYNELRKNGTYPDDFISEVKKNDQLVNSISLLAQKQLDIIKKTSVAILIASKEHLKTLVKEYFLMIDRPVA